MSTTLHPTPPDIPAHTPRRAFTLLEAIMAIGILLVTITAVSSAITTGQEQALEANQRIAATLAAEELMGRISIAPYNSLNAWDGFSENPGAMAAMNADGLPQVYGTIGRSVEIIPTLRNLADVGVKVRGVNVHVSAFNSHGRVMADLFHFIPEPQP